MQKQFTIVARIVAKEGKEDLVKQELLKLVEPTKKQAGFIQYDLHQDNDNKNVFLFYENWENREIWQEHMNSQILVDYMKNTEGAVEEFTVNEMTKI